MATTPEDVKNSADAYAAGFDEADAAAPEQSEDAAFGLDIEAAVAAEGGAPEGDAPAGDEVANTAPEAAAAAEPEAAAVSGMEPAADAGESTAAVAAEADDDEPTDPKEIQRKKSWEGRLRAEEQRLAAARAELEAKAAGSGAPAEEVAGDAIEEVAEEAAAQGNQELAAQATEVADKVESGEMSVDEAVKMLSDDFGEPFVKLIEKVAGAVAKKMIESDVNSLREDTKSIIDHIQSRETKAHFQAIESAHPDFADVAKDPAFVEWKDGDPTRAQTVAGGTAEAINALLTEWKEQGAGGAVGGEPEPVAEAAPAAEPISAEAPSEDEIDAAEGVRSAGMQLPEEPTPAGGYEDAWDEFERSDRKASA